MSAVIVEADYQAAHACMERTGRSFLCRGGHDFDCGSIAQAIADAREAENRACEREVALMVTAAGADGKVSQTIALGEARLAIAARRSPR